MVHIQKFEDVIAWQQAHELTIELYKIFGKHSGFGFRDQILRAGVSIMNNIAEGFDRQGRQELIHFLVIARGSAAEVRSMLILAQSLDYISAVQKDDLILRASRISRLLTGFISSLATDNRQPRAAQ
jgi:four helix bundle protein